MDVSDIKYVVIMFLVGLLVLAVIIFLVSVPWMIRDMWIRDNHPSHVEFTGKTDLGEPTASVYMYYLPTARSRALRERMDKKYYGGFYPEGRYIEYKFIKIEGEWEGQDIDNKTDLRAAYRVLKKELRDRGMI